MNGVADPRWAPFRPDRFSSLPAPTATPVHIVTIDPNKETA
jgi:glycine oxidase